jgi:hypothetical protein
MSDRDVAVMPQVLEHYQLVGPLIGAPTLLDVAAVRFGRIVLAAPPGSELRAR